VLFRRSLHDSMLRSGYLPAGTPLPDLDAAWPRHEAVLGHLTATCAQWWLAEDPTASRSATRARSSARARSS